MHDWTTSNVQRKTICPHFVLNECNLIFKTTAENAFLSSVDPVIVSCEINCSPDTSSCDSNVTLIWKGLVFGNRGRGSMRKYKGQGLDKFRLGFLSQSLTRRQLFFTVLQTKAA